MRIIHLKQVESTQIYAKSFLKKKNINTDFAILADTQTDGIGRNNRTWYSPENKGLYFSIITTKKSIISYQFSVGVAIVEYFKEQFNIELTLKWPNDIYYKNKKAGGILIDTIYNGKIFNTAIIGIGINISNIIDDKSYPENSISLQITNCDIELIAKNIYNFIISKFNDINVLKQYDIYSCCLNKNVKIKLYNNSIVKGEVMGFTKEGGIKIKNNNSETVILSCKKLLFT